MQLGEELLSQGDIENGVEHLSLAVAVCGQPHSLLGVLQQTLPPQVSFFKFTRLECYNVNWFWNLAFRSISCYYRISIWLNNAFEVIWARPSQAWFGASIPPEWEVPVLDPLDPMAPQDREWTKKMSSDCQIPSVKVKIWSTQLADKTRIVIWMLFCWFTLDYHESVSRHSKVYHQSLIFALCLMNKCMSLLWWVFWSFCEMQWMFGWDIETRQLKQLHDDWFSSPLFRALDEAGPCHELNKICQQNQKDQKNVWSMSIEVF